MPTERFERLSELKKRRIAKAIMDEMEQNSIEKLNMCRIAKKASISRGSLYLYFENKSDMICFSLCRERERKLEQDKIRFQENGGDFWDMMAQSLQEQLSDYGRETESLYHFLYLPGRQTFFMLQKARRIQSDQLAEYKGWVYRNCINQEIRRLTESEFDALDDMCRALMMVSIQEYISGSQDQENIMSFFRDRLKLIRASISRQS